MAAKKTTVPAYTVELDRQVIAARAYAWQNNAGGYSVERGLEVVGLKDTVSHGGTGDNVVFTVSTAALVKALANKPLTIRDRAKGSGDIRHLGDGKYLAYDAMTKVINTWQRELTEGDFTTDAARVPTVREVTDAWGATGPLPDGTAEVNAARTELVNKLLDWAADNGVCGTVEEGLDYIGLTAFGPPRALPVTVDVPGLGPLTLEVPCNRKGEVRPEEIGKAVSKHIRDLITDERGHVAYKVAATVVATDTITV